MIFSSILIEDAVAEFSKLWGIDKKSALKSFNKKAIPDKPASLLK